MKDLKNFDKFKITPDQQGLLYALEATALVWKTLAITLGTEQSLGLETEAWVGRAHTVSPERQLVGLSPLCEFDARRQLEGGSFYFFSCKFCPLTSGWKNHSKDCTDQDSLYLRWKNATNDEDKKAFALVIAHEAQQRATALRKAQEKQSPGENQN